MREGLQGPCKMQGNSARFSADSWPAGPSSCTSSPQPDSSHRTHPLHYWGEYRSRHHERREMSSLHITFSHPSFILPKASPAFLPWLKHESLFNDTAAVLWWSPLPQRGQASPAQNSTKAADTMPRPPRHHPPLPPAWSLPGVLAVTCVLLLPRSLSPVPISLPASHPHFWQVPYYPHMEIPRHQLHT